MGCYKCVYRFLDIRFKCIHLDKDASLIVTLLGQKKNLKETWSEKISKVLYRENSISKTCVMCNGDK